MFTHKRLSENGVIAIRRREDEKIIIVKYNCSNRKLDIVKKESAYYRHMSIVSPCFSSFPKFYCVTNSDYISIPFDNTNAVAICRKQMGIKEDTKNVFLMVDVFDASYEKFSKVWNNGLEITKMIPVVYDLMSLIQNVMHDNNFIHGDLNLSNLLYNRTTKKFKIIDLEYSVLTITEGIEVNELYNYNLRYYLCDHMIYNKSYVELLDIIVPIIALLCQCSNEISFINVYDVFIKYYESIKNDTIIPKAFLTTIVLLQVLKEFDYSLINMNFDNGKKHLLVYHSVLASKTNLDILFSHKCVERTDDELFVAHNDLLIRVVECNRKGISFENNLLLSDSNTSVNDISESLYMSDTLSKDLTSPDSVTPNSLHVSPQSSPALSY